MKQNAKTSIFLLAAFLIGFFTGTNPSVQNYINEKRAAEQNTGFTSPTPNPKYPADQFVDLTPFWDTYHTIFEEYVDAHILENNMSASYGAAKGLVQSLNDPYSSYLDPKESNSFREDLNGELEGIGAEIAIKDGNLTVVTPLKESPAEKAGILPRDIIYKIDGEVTDGISVHEAVNRIKGEKGSVVNLTIIREDQINPLEFSITRDKIYLESVSWELIDNDLMLISINQFSDDTASEFKKAVQDALVRKPKGVIIDLRYNGGGYLESAVSILSELISGEQKIVSTRGRTSVNNRIFYSDGNARLKDVPLAVLINGGSASASEIVAGAIQDLKRGILIGEQSFGKGSVQEVFDLSDQSSLILSVAKWYTPNDRNVTGVGLTPDRVVELTIDDYTNEKDPQMEEAIRYLQSL